MASARPAKVAPRGAPAWVRELERGWRRGADQAASLRRGIGVLARAKFPARVPLALPEQPFDRHLLALSPLYRRSRRLYLEGGGRFTAALVSSPRTLSSPILLEQEIEYSPIERELVWAATDPRERRRPEHLLELRTYSSSLFHEQSHRLLWRWLPPAPREGGAALRRYLNFVESLVIILDMALGDELGPRVAPLFYLAGVTYDPGTDVRGLAGVDRRAYRNYLQAALHATYLLLERYEARDLPRAIRALFPGLGELAERAAARASRLDPGFVQRTNPVWQARHGELVLRALSRPREPGLVLSADPLDNRAQYLLAESWLDRMGL